MQQKANRKDQTRAGGTPPLEARGKTPPHSKPLCTRRFTCRPVMNHLKMRNLHAVPDAAQLCGFLLCCLNQLPKVLISKRAASPLTDSGRSVARFASERKHSGPWAGSATSSYWRKSRGSSGSGSQFGARWGGGVGATSTLPKHKKYKPHWQDSQHRPPSIASSLPPPALSDASVSAAAEEKAPVEDDLIDGRAHSLAIHSAVLCDSPDHQHLPQHCCHVGPLAVNTDKSHSFERLSCPLCGGAMTARWGSVQ